MKHSGMLGTEPTEDGTYVAEVYYGWKIIEWHAGEWWHTERVGRWSASKPLQWVGPLPSLVGKREKSYDL